MKIAQMLEELENACPRVGVAVVYAELTGEGMSTGGLCRVKGEWRVIIEKRASTSEKASILARSLARFDLEDLYLPPKVRELVARHRPTVEDSDATEVAEQAEPPTA